MHYFLELTKLLISIHNPGPLAQADLCFDSYPFTQQYNVFQNYSQADTWFVKFWFIAQPFS